MSNTHISGNLEITGTLDTNQAVTKLAWTPAATTTGLRNGTASLPGDLLIPSQGLNMSNAAGTVLGSFSATGAFGTTASSETLNGATGTAAKAYTKSVFTKAAIVDNTITTVCTMTIPNALNAAAFRVLVMSSLTGANAYESTRVAEYLIVVTRTVGVAAVAAIALVTAAATTIATISGGATLTTTLALGAVTGGATVTETVAIRVTNVGSVAQTSETTIVIEELNALGSGISLA